MPLINATRHPQCDIKYLPVSYTDMETTQTTVVLINEEEGYSLINPKVVEFLMTFNLLICAEVIGLLGILANFITISVFAKQGYDDSVNITLTALAVSDIGSLVTLQIYNVLMSPWLSQLDLPFVQVDLVSLASFYPHNYFVRVGGFITAFASFERCLCVLIPLKVKRVITKKVSVYVNLLIFLIMLLDLVPAYYVVYLDWIYVPELNRTLLMAAFHEDPNVVFDYSYIVTDLFIPYITFGIIIVCTCVVVVKLKSRAMWRSSVSVVKDKTIPGKEKKLVLMLVVVSVIFTVCLMPQSAILTAVGLVDELGVRGRNFDVALVCYSIAYLFESVSSSINLIVYYRMSTKFRYTLFDIFKRPHK
ncbi:galanin receptor 2b-like [Physella acuta]|uniref:galanin receptor 2b-like n=1 Tax=Physella acuta TaxID=109671 RepID=UPI0027DCD24A|nr:galanin receptor 2b-like [Physella acuta]